MYVADTCLTFMLYLGRSPYFSIEVLRRSSVLFHAVNGSVMGALSSWLAVTRRTVVALWSAIMGSYLISLLGLDSKSMIYVSGDGLCLWASGCFESELDATMIRALSSLLAMTRRIVFTVWSANMVLSLSIKVFISNLRPVDTNLQHNFFEVVLLVIKVTRSTRISSCASWNALGLYVMMFPTR